MSTEYLPFAKAAQQLRAINNKKRQRIIEAIRKTGRITVTDLYLKTKEGQSPTSQHLAILRKAGLVKTQREGKFIYYSVDESNLQALKQYCEQISKIRV